MYVHIFDRGNSGNLNHNVKYNEDLAGVYDVTGPIEHLAGWPTPAMLRSAHVPVASRKDFSF